MYMTPTVTSSVEGFAGAAVEQGLLTLGEQVRQREHVADVHFLCTVEDRRREVHTFLTPPASA